MLVTWRASWLLVTVALLAAAGCEAQGGGALIVDLRSDLRPGYEFTRARVTLLGAGTDSDVRQERDFGPGDEASLVDGLRIAEFDAVDQSTASVRVTLIAPEGHTLLERVIRVSGLETSRAVTAILSRDCRGVQCPDPGGDAEQTECLAGRCVDPTCTPEDPTSCGTPACLNDTECGGLSSCATGVCGEGGVCLQVVDDTLCAADEYCLPETGCVAVPSVTDAGMDAATDGSTDATLDAGDAPDAGVDADAATDADADAVMDASAEGGPRCGDDVVDLGEACDDGNAIAGDGCSPTCRLEGDSCADALDMAVVGAVQPDGSLLVRSSLARATDSISVHSTYSTPDRIYYWDTPDEGWLIWSTDTATLEFDSYMCTRNVCTDATTSLGCNDDRGTIMRLASIMHVGVAAGDRVYAIVEPNEAGCCEFDLVVSWRRYLEVGEACTPSYWEDDCRPPSRCVAVDGGNACQ